MPFVLNIRTFSIFLDLAKNVWSNCHNLFLVWACNLNLKTRGRWNSKPRGDFTALSITITCCAANWKFCQTGTDNHISNLPPVSPPPIFSRVSLLSYSHPYIYTSEIETDRISPISFLYCAMNPFCSFSMELARARGVNCWRAETVLPAVDSRIGVFLRLVRLWRFDSLT